MVRLLSIGDSGFVLAVNSFPPIVTKLGDNMIYKNAIMTDRAFILYSNIQHISWDVEPENMFLLKIYSNGGKIVQLMSPEVYESFMISYKVFSGVLE